MISDFFQFGGTPLYPVNADTRSTADPSNIIWNFGVQPPPESVVQMIQARPTLYQRFPNIQGKWDGISSVNHWTAVTKVLGSKADELIQSQPRGTCGGRAGSAGIDILQCNLIASGQRAMFKRASHAFLYWQARKKYGMDKGDPKDDGNDGVAGGSIPEVMASVGLDTREETNDLNSYGEGSDDLACQWGAGKISADLAKSLVEYAKDNVVTAWAPVTSAQELADGIAAGGVGIGSDMQGFSMERDNDGFCKAQGQWAHYQVRLSVFKNSKGRKGFGYYQSWGTGTPQGTKLLGHPGNCFGVDWDVQDRVTKNGEWAIVFSFPLFELDKGNYDIPWMFSPRVSG